MIFPAVSVYRFASGKIIESRMFHFDTASLLRFLRTALVNVEDE